MYGLTGGRPRTPHSGSSAAWQGHPFGVYCAKLLVGDIRLSASFRFRLLHRLACGCHSLVECQSSFCSLSCGARACFHRWGRRWAGGGTCGVCWSLFQSAQFGFVFVYTVVDRFPVPRVERAARLGAFCCFLSSTRLGEANLPRGSTALCCCCRVLWFVCSVAVVRVVCHCLALEPAKRRL